MSYESIEEAAFRRLMAELREMRLEMRELKELQLMNTTKLDDTKVVYNNRQVCELLGVHKNTLQMYRDEGKINFSRRGRKIFYTRADVEQFLGSASRSLPPGDEPIGHPMVRA